MDVVKFGIIGIGNMGTGHTNSISTLSNAKLTAVCDINPKAFDRMKPEIRKDVKCFTDAENYSVTAETVYKFLTNNPDFVEAHTALADAEIEADILRAAFLNGAMIDMEYSKQMPKRKVLKPFKIMVDGVVVAQGKYVRKWSKKDDIRFVTENA